MNSTREALAVEEYRALRATIRERGTVRLIVIAITFVAWAGLLLAAWPGTGSQPALTLVPLVALAAGFESALAAHVAAERIGRYVALRYEAPGDATPRWEHDVLRFAQAGTAFRLDPLAAPLFVSAAVLNLGSAAVFGLAGAPMPRAAAASFLVALGGHAAFVIRVTRSRHRAASQRTEDAAALSRDA
jgi:hypothetical protein